MKILSTDINQISKNIQVTEYINGWAIYSNWNVFYTELGGFTWVKNILTGEQLISPVYLSISFPKRDHRYFIWQKYDSLSTFDIIDITTGIIVKSIDYTKNQTTIPDSIDIFWKYMIQYFQSAGDDFWEVNTKVSVTNIETGTEKIIEYSTDAMNLTNWITINSDELVFNYNPWTGDLTLMDIELNEITIPEWYQLSWYKSSEWMVTLKKEWTKNSIPWQDYYLWDAKLKTSPIWPYEWTSFFSEGKCIVLQNWGTKWIVIDKEGNELFNIEWFKNKYDFDKWKRLFRSSEADNVNMFNDWKLIFLWKMYNTEWKIICEFEWNDVEQKNLLIKNNNNWIFLWIRNDWITEPKTCLFNDIGTVLFKDDSRNQKGHMYFKLSDKFIRYCPGNRELEVFNDTEYLVDVLHWKCNFLKIIEKDNTSTYIAKWRWTRDEIFKDRIMNLDDLLWKLSKVDELSNEIIEIDWKKFKRKLMKL